MYHNFFIRSSVDGHLGCFHALAIVNSAAMNNEIHVSFSTLVSSGYMPRSGIAGSYGGFPGGQMVKHLPAMWETQVRSLDWEDPLEKEMTTHSSTFAWKIARTEEPGRLQSMGSQRVRHNWATSLSFLSFFLWWFYSQFFKESPYRLSQRLYQFTSPSTVQEHSLFSTPSPAFIVCRLFDDGHSDWCEVISPLWFWFAFL